MRIPAVIIIMILEVEIMVIMVIKLVLAPQVGAGLLLARSLVRRTDVHHAVRIDVKGHLSHKA